MVNEIEGSYHVPKASVGVVLSEFNELITDRLYKGALRALTRSGVSDDDITLYRVPGSFEIPDMARKAKEHSSHDGILCLGAVIRGDTPHFDYICSSVTQGIGNLNMESDIPITFGILTTDTVEQAIERAGTKAGNKGHETALALVQMIDAYRKL